MAIREDSFPIFKIYILHIRLILLLSVCLMVIDYAIRCFILLPFY